MKAIYKAYPEPGGLEIREVDIPKLKPTDVLIKIKALAICGTDLHIYNWDSWSQNRLKLPRIIGHEFCGEVVEVGPDVVDFVPGDYVSGEGHLFCGYCKMCRTGQAHVCEHWVGLGYDVDGCFAEYLVLPQRNVWRNAPSLPPEVTAIQDPLGNAVHAVFTAECTTKNVAIFGAGPVGVLAVAVAKAAGAERVISIEKSNGYRMELARKAGADHVFNIDEIDDIPEAIRLVTRRKGVDVAIELAGANRAIQDAMKSTRSNGDVVLLGIPPGKVPIDIAEDVVFKSLRLHGVVGRRIYDTWYRMAALLVSGKLDVKPFITHTFAFEEYEEAFKLMQSGMCGKVILRMEE